MRPHAPYPASSGRGGHRVIGRGRTRLPPGPTAAEARARRIHVFLDDRPEGLPRALIRRAVENDVLDEKESDKHKTEKRRASQMFHHGQERMFQRIK